MNTIIKKNRTRYDILFTAVIIIIGAVTCIVAPKGMTLVMGISFIIVGAICWFILKSGYLDIETRKTLSKTEVYYPVEHKSLVLKSVLDDPSALSELKQSPMNTIKLDIYYNEDDAYIQMFEYVPCNYHPCTKMIKCEAEKVKKILS